jgi:hypothetical protein
LKSQGTHLDGVPMVWFSRKFLFSKYAHILVGPEAIKEILTNTARFPKLEQSYRFLKEYIGDGLVTAKVVFSKF